MSRGSIKKRGDAWLIRVELEPDLTSGKRRQKTETVHGTKRQAEKRLNELIAEADKGLIGTAGDMTLKAYLEQWLKDYVETTLSLMSITRYTNLVHNHIVPHIGHIQLEKLRPAHIDALHTRLREAKGANAKQRPLSAATRRYVHAVLNSALTYAIERRLIATNPMRAVKPPKKTHVEMRYFDQHQAKAFLDASSIYGQHWHVFFTVALTTGLRLGEMLGLRWQDVDLAARTLVVRQTSQRILKVGVVCKEPKTASSRRSVSLGAEVVTLLRKHRAAQNEERLRCGSAWQDHNLVFPNHAGKPLDAATVRYAMRRICARANVPVIRIHDLRHTAATLMLIAGVHPKVVSERLGHSSVTITLEVYSHVTANMQQDAAATLDALLEVKEQR